MYPNNWEKLTVEERLRIFRQYSPAMPPKLSSKKTRQLAKEAMSEAGKGTDLPDPVFTMRGDDDHTYVYPDYGVEVRVNKFTGSTKVVPAEPVLVGHN